MRLGICYDYNPSEGAIKNLAAAAPDAPWAIHSHVFWTQLRGRPVGYLVTRWGMHGAGEVSTVETGMPCRPALSFLLKSAGPHAA